MPIFVKGFESGEDVAPPATAKPEQLNARADCRIYCTMCGATVFEFWAGDRFDVDHTHRICPNLIFAWLGRWRDHLPVEAVSSLQDIAGGKFLTTIQDNEQ